MEKGKKLLLPPLNVEENVVESQCWKKENDPYDYLIRNLKLSYEPVDSIFDGKSSAMPHVFEQMLLFERAFWDQRNPDHLRAVLEWRAVLAIMALPRLCNLRLTLHKVDFQVPANPFLDAAAEFRPTDQSPPVFDQTTWDFLYVLRLDGTAIAVFSPTTLVCPAKQFKQRISSLEWLTLGTANGVEQLTLKFQGRGNQKASLALWLEELRGSLDPAERESELKKKVEQVKSELSAFAKEVAPDRENIEVMLYRDLYPAINRSRRQEYSFFNNCCDFSLIDPSMEFLVKRYQQDIFQSSLMVVVYNRTVDSMSRQPHIPLLDGLFSNVFQLEGRPVTEIRLEGGNRVAAYALLPFNPSFVKELIEHQLTPEMLMEEYTAVYRNDLDAVEVTLQIRGFPYVFCKRFPRANWKLVYGTELPSVRLWPSVDLKQNLWGAYYVHTCASKTQLTRWEVPEAEDVNTLAPPRGDGPEVQISRVKLFPSFLHCVCGSDSGYLPVRANGRGTGLVGATALLLLDVGHTSTAVKLLRFSNTDAYPPAPLDFWAPRAVRFAGAPGDQEEDFISTRESAETTALTSFKNIVKTHRNYDIRTKGEAPRPFEDSVVLFDLPDKLTSLRSRAIDFLNFKYSDMDLQGRRNAHAFIEQLLLYAAYTAAQHQCSYLQVGFLHSCPENDCQLGELEQIFCESLNKVRDLSGLKRSPDPAIVQMTESRALVYRLYEEIVKNTDQGAEPAEENTAYAAVDIGWQKATLAAILDAGDRYAKKNTAVDIGGQKATLTEVLDAGDHPEANYTQIEFAGRDFSLLDIEERLRCYPDLLNILLRGTEKVDANMPEGILLEELRQYCLGTGKENPSFYYGIFDVIAQKIDEAGYASRPDVYNCTYEFRALLQMLTYNMLLLFLNIGYMMGRFFLNGSEPPKHIRLYLTGNGSKFLNWICNLKNPDCIDESNVDEMFILRLSYTAIDAIRRGFRISNNLCGTDLRVSIYPLKDGKQQLLNGFALKEQPKLFGLKHTPPDFQVEWVNNSFPKESTSASGCRSSLYHEMILLRQAVFGSGIQGTQVLCKRSTLLDECIKVESRSVCSAVIKQINDM